MSSKLVQRSTGVAAALVLAFAVTPSPSAKADFGQTVRTQSGKVRCQVMADHNGSPTVACQRNDGNDPYFPQAPISPQFGTRANVAEVGSDGNLQWRVANIAGSPEVVASDVVLNYGQTYRINGWTIQPSFEGTRFTNDATGHGMFVSIDNVFGF